MYYLFACFVCSILLAYGKILILLTLSKYNDVLLYLRIMMQDLYNKVGLDSCGSDNRMNDTPILIRKNIFFMVLRKKNVSIIRLERAFIPTMNPRLEQEKKCN